MQAVGLFFLLVHHVAITFKNEVIDYGKGYPV